jgi:hypothetical protein
MYNRMPNTAKTILTDGDFAKIGKKHYRHVSGDEIIYDCNAWAWRTPYGSWSLLWPAVAAVRAARS